MRFKNFIGIIVCLIIVLIRVFWDNLFFWKNIGNKNPIFNFSGFSPIKMALSRRTFPELFADKAVGVQPMKEPVGLAYGMRFSGDGFTKPKGDPVEEKPFSWKPRMLYTKWLVGKTKKKPDVKITTVDYSEMKIDDSDKSIVVKPKTLKGPILESTPITSEKRKIKTRKELEEKWGKTPPNLVNGSGDPEVDSVIRKLLNNQIEAQEKGPFHNLPPSPFTGAPHVSPEKITNDGRNLIKKIFQKGI